MFLIINTFLIETRTSSNPDVKNQVVLIKKQTHTHYLVINNRTTTHLFKLIALLGLSKKSINKIHIVRNAHRPQL